MQQERRVWRVRYLAIVAHNDVAAGSGREAVVAEAAHDDVATIGHVNDVVATVVRFDRLERRHHAVVVPVELAVVAHHEVGKVTRCGHSVGAHACDDSILSAAASDRVVPQQLIDRVGAFKLDGHIADRRAGEQQRAVIADDPVGSGSRCDAVRSLTRQDSVVSFANVDCVGCALCVKRGLNLLKHTSGRPVDLAIVPNHQVRAAERRHGVGAFATENQVVSRSRTDGVVSTESRIGRLHLLQK